MCVRQSLLAVLQLPVMIPRHKQVRWALFTFVLLLLLFWWRLLAFSAHNAPTMDETLHIYHGVLYWRLPPAQMLHNITNNPPLVNSIIGLTTNLLARPEIELPPGVMAHGDPVYASQQFMWQVNAPGLQLVWAGRLAVMMLAVLLAALIYNWSRRLFKSETAALFALLLYTFDPNVLAHSGLATLDSGTAFFLVLAAYGVWAYWKRPFGRTFLLTGIALGLAVGAKFSGIVIFPAILVTAVYRWWQIGWKNVAWRREVAVIASWGIMAFAVFLLTYRLDMVMLGRDFLWQQMHQFSGHPGFLLGEVSRAGWWYYFPVLFAVKTPLAALILVGFVICLFLWRRVYDWQRLWLLVIAGGLFAMSMLTRVNIGYRYLLPALPFLFIFSSQLAQPHYVAAKVGKLTVAFAAGWLVVSSLLIHPHYLAYFNQIAGGPDNGWQVVVDSNIDWGQDVAALGAYVAQREAVAEIQGAWLSVVPPEVYGIELGDWYTPSPQSAQIDLYGRFYPPRPAPATYVFSVSHVQGVFEQPQSSLAWFREREPDERVGNSLFVYEVLPDGPAQGVAFSGIGLLTISPEDFDAFFASNDVLPRWYDARTAVLWPGGDQGRPPAQTWAAVGDAHQPTQPALQAFYPPEGKTAVGQNSQGDEIHYLLYNWSHSPMQAALADSNRDIRQDFRWSAAAVVGSGALAAQSEPIANPVFGKTMALLAYEMVTPQVDMKPGGTIELLTYWRVQETPSTQLKLFLHLLDGKGEVMAQHDGLDVVSESLYPGDEFVQLHTISLPAELAAGDYAWQVGVYDEKSGQRLTVPVENGIVDRLLLGQMINLQP